MARTGVVVCVLAVVAVGGYAAAPDDEPEYLGDMPSIIEQAEAAPSLPREFVPPPEPPQGPRVDGPDPVVPEAPPRIPVAPGERVPDPVTDAVRDVDPNTSDSGPSRPANPLLGLLDQLPGDEVLACVDGGTIFRELQGTFDCVTGELLSPDPACEVLPPLPLPVGCPPPD